MKSIKLETTKKFKHYGEKVKQISFHPSKPLVLMAHYNGEVSIYNYNTQTLTKKLEVSTKPIRTSIWAGEDWIVAGGDDLKVRVFNYHTTQKLHEFEGHKDFLRKVIFNPNFQYFLTCSDDKTIIRWNLVQDKFSNVFNYEEHKHFVMDVKLQSNTEDVFASASLDGTIKVWNINSKNSNYTLKGHKAGINCIEFSKGNRPLLASGGDDFAVIIWDLAARTMLQKIEKHEGNVVDLVFMTSLPFLVSIAEDGKCNFYNTRNFEFCFDQNNFMQKGWSVTAKENLIACGYDEGALVLQIGKNNSLASCGKGKLVWSKNNEIFSANLKAVVTKNLRNFEKIELENKEMGGLEIFPHKILHNDNAQFFALVDDSEYLIYKSQTYKQVLYGKCKEFAWGAQNKFAILDQHNDLTIQNVNGTTVATLKFDFYVEAIFGGTLLGICAGDFVIFYDWNGESNIGRIDVECSNLLWDNKTLVVKSTKTFFVLKVNPELDDESVFELLYEVPDVFIGGLFLSGIFFYASDTFKLQVVLRGKSFSLASLGFAAQPLEYLDNHERLFFFDSNCNTSSFKISQNLLKLLGGLETKVQPDEESLMEKGLLLTEDENTFLVKVLVSFEFFDLAFKVAKNTGQKIELGIKQKKLEECLILCEELKENIYWKKLGDLGLFEGQFDLAEKAFWSCEDLNSLFLLGISTGDVSLLEKVAKMAKDKRNYAVAYNVFWTLGKAEECLVVLLESERFGEAVIFARSYLPSQIKTVYSAWTSEANSLGNQLLVKKINRFAVNEENNKEAVELETLFKSLSIQLSVQNLNKFNEDLRKLDLNILFAEHGKDKVQEIIEALRSKYEPHAVNKPGDAPEEEWKDTVPSDAVD